MIGHVPEQPSANRPNDEATGKQHRCVQLLDDRIGARKEGRGEVQGKGGVGVEVVPLDEVANRADENRLDATAHVRRGVGGNRCRAGVGRYDC